MAITREKCAGYYVRMILGIGKCTTDVKMPLSRRAFRAQKNETVERYIVSIYCFRFGGPEGIRTLDLSDANELKTLICIDFQTFPALSAGMQMALWPLFPVVTMCPGSVCGTRCGHRKTGGKASILGAPIIARNRKSVNGFLNPWRRKPLDAIIKE